MKRYSTKFKSRMVQRMTGAEGISACALQRETGVTRVTLSRWLKEFSKVPSMSKQNNSHSKRRGRRSAADKLRILFEASDLPDERLGELLRREGIHEEDLTEWRSKATVALKDGKRKKSETTPEAIEIRNLKRELRRKEKALAEAAALLVLKKTLSDYFEEEDESTQKRTDK